MPSIYRKTAKGQAEIGTRIHRLAPRLRTALILVDGRRDDAALGALLPDGGSDALKQLEAEGFIEAQAGPPAAVPAPPLVAALPPLDQRRRDAVRHLTELVGPLGEALAIRIEKAPDAAALQALLDVACQVVRNTRGARQAEDFAARHLGGAPQRAA